jgi:ribonuclease P protein component
MIGLVANVHDEERATPRPQLWRVTDRSTFVELRRRGQRARRGPISLAWLPPDPALPATPPRVAFAVGKAAGGAVQRNRIRRRLRAALRALQGQGRLPAGTYLLGAQPTVLQLPWAELVAMLEAAIGATGADAS